MPGLSLSHIYSKGKLNQTDYFLSSLIRLAPLSIMTFRQIHLLSKTRNQ